MKEIQREFKENESFLRRYGGKIALTGITIVAVAALSPYAAGVVATTSAASWTAYHVTKNKMTAQPQGAKPQGVFRKAFNGVVISAATLATMALSAAGSFHTAALVKHNRETPNARGMAIEMQAALNNDHGTLPIVEHNGDKAFALGHGRYAPIAKDGESCSFEVSGTDFWTGTPTVWSYTVSRAWTKPVATKSRTLDF